MTWKRVATAAVLIPIFVGLVLLAPTIWVAIATSLVIVVALLEYFSMGDAIGHRGYRSWTVACALLLVCLQWLISAVRYGDFGQMYVMPQVAWLFMRMSPTTQDVFFLFVIGIALLTLFTKRPLVEGLPAAGISASGLLLVAFPLTFAVRLHAISGVGPYLLLFALVITWAGDTTAYFVGRAIGRRPLAPHLSPKKTWEGTIGSVAGSLIVGVLFARKIHVPMGQLLGMAVAGNVAGQIGDLLESAYKRSAGIKDSGSLLPGHGGVLDRIDALILAIPVVWYYWTLFCSPTI